MDKRKVILIGAAAALLLSGSAWAAALQPAAGEFAASSQPAATRTALTRSTVEAQAAVNPPAAGEQSGVNTAVRQAHAAERATPTLAELRASTSPEAEAATY